MFPTNFNVKIDKIDAYGTQRWVTDGIQCWMREGMPHRDGDLPALIEADGSQCWFKDGAPHRDGDLPASITADGSREWWKDGKLHRDNDLPADIRASGAQRWYKEGKQHRDGDLPAEILANGEQRWYKDGKKHRANDLPAEIKADGSHGWYLHGEEIYVLSKAEIDAKEAEQRKRRVTSPPPQLPNADENECVVCFDQPREGVFVPCGHIHCCMHCGSQLSKCPTCRTPVSQLIRVFK